MGSGISLNERQVEQIIKRDFSNEYAEFKRSPPPCNPQYTIYRDYLEESRYNANIDMVDKYSLKRQESTHMNL